MATWLRDSYSFDSIGSIALFAALSRGLVDAYPFESKVETVSAIESKILCCELRVVSEKRVERKASCEL